MISWEIGQYKQTTVSSAGKQATHIGILDNVDMQAAIQRLELEIGDGGVELNLRKTVANGLVDSRALVALVLDAAQVCLKGILGGISVVDRDGDTTPEVLLLPVSHEELLPVGLVAEVHGQVEDPSGVELALNLSFILGGSHGPHVDQGEGVVVTAKTGIDRIPIHVVEAVQVTGGMPILSRRADGVGWR